MEHHVREGNRVSGRGHRGGCWYGRAVWAPEHAVEGRQRQAARASRAGREGRQGGPASGRRWYRSPVMSELSTWGNMNFKTDTFNLQVWDFNSISMLKAPVYGWLCGGSVVDVVLIHEGGVLGKGVGGDTPGDGAVHEDLSHGEHVHR